MKSSNPVVFHSRRKFGFGDLIDKFCIRWMAHRKVSLSSPRMAVFARDHIGFHVNAYGVYERDDLQVLTSFLAPLREKFSAGCALDVGANVGNHSLFFSHLFSRVLSVEPHPDTFRILEFNARAAQNIQCFNMALGDVSGFLELMSIPGNMGASSFAMGAHSSSGVSVPVRTADDAFSDAGPVELMKIDVEGFECAVLRGASTLIAREQPVIVFEQLWDEFEGGDTPSIAYLRQHGYQFVWFDDAVARNRWTARRLRNLSSLIFGESSRLRVGTHVPPASHAMVIAVPPRYLGALC